MNNTKIFMTITAIISIVCFNFNKVLDCILSFVANNVYDESVLSYGPYIKSNPITVKRAMIDTNMYTNKTKLLLNWKWNFDMSGFTTSDILLLKPDASKMILQYVKNYGGEPDLIHTLNINFENSTIIENGITRDIMFEEICLFK